MTMSVDDDFILVKYRRNRRKPIPDCSSLNTDSGDVKANISREKVLRKLNESQMLLRSSKQFDSFLDAIKICNNILKMQNETEGPFKEIVCYGIGNFSTSRPSLHQVALLMELKSFYNVPVNLFDPVLSECEKEFLNFLNVNLIQINEKGKRKVVDKTIFYLPHCPWKIFNNLLRINWGLSLANCIIIGNCHSLLITNTPISMRQSFWYLNNISQAIIEVPIPNIFTHDDVFNSLGVHGFVMDKLKSLPSKILSFQEDPAKDSEDSDEELTESDNPSAKIP